MRTLATTRRPRRSRAPRLVASLLAGAVPSLAALLTGCAADGNRGSGAGGGGAPPVETVRTSSDIRTMIAQARDKVFPALVHIDVVSAENWGGKKVKHRSTGSGTIISDQGYILTNNHVTDKGTIYWATLADKRRLTAKLIGEDPFTDLAVLKVDPKELFSAGDAIRVASLGDSSRLQVGDYVMAMGSPFALSRTVTLGVVSNNERVFTQGLGEGEVDEMTLDGEQRTGIFTNWIQHDALINPGNSGGPLVDLSGNVIGVNTRGGASMGFATPSSLARTVADAIIKQGEVLRSWVGISFRHIEDTGIEQGVLVDSVDTDGPAAAAGLKPGDVVLAIGGKPTTVRFPEQIPPLLKQIADLPIGGSVEVSYLRDGKPEKATIVTQKLLKDRGDEAALRGWGITAKRITARTARALRLTSTEGVLVDSTRAGGAAELAEPALGGGDVIKSIDSQPTKALPDLVAYYEKISAMETPPKWVLLEFDRHGKNFLTLVKAKQEKDPDPTPEVPKSWIGVDTQPVVQKLVDKLGPPTEPGYRVTRVFSGTKAKEAGLKIGDLILTVNGEKLKPRGQEDGGLFGRVVRALPIDSTTELTVLRDGEKITVPVVTERTRLTSDKARRDKNTDFELTVREITFFDRDENQWSDDVAGVLIDQAESAGWAGLGGLRAGDLVQKIAGHDIKTMDEYRLVMKDLTQDKPKRIVFVVLRGIRTYFKFVEPEWSADDDKADKNGADPKKPRTETPPNQGASK